MKPTGLFINLHKALVIPVTVAAMITFANYGTVMWLYLAMHGTYSILWLIKGCTYPIGGLPNKWRSGFGRTFLRWPATTPPRFCWRGSNPMCPVSPSAVGVTVYILTSSSLCFGRQKIFA